MRAGASAVRNRPAASRRAARRNVAVHPSPLGGRGGDRGRRGRSGQTITSCGPAECRRVSGESSRVGRPQTVGSQPFTHPATSVSSALTSSHARGRSSPRPRCRPEEIPRRSKSSIPHWVAIIRSEQDRRAAEAGLARYFEGSFADGQQTYSDRHTGADPERVLAHTSKLARVDGYLFTAITGGEDQLHAIATELRPLLTSA